jgi:hypothetical protein
MSTRLMSKDLLAFWSEIQNVARIIRVLFADDVKRRKRFFEELQLISETAFNGSASYSDDIGTANIREVKYSIASEFPVVRDKLWKSYFKCLVFFTLVFGTIGGVIYCDSCDSAFVETVLAGLGWHVGWNVPPPTGGIFNWYVALAISFFWIPTGVALGIFLEFVFRIGDDLSFDGIQTINPGRWNPFQRVINTTATSYCFAGLMAIGVFQVGVSNQLLNDFTRNPALSTAIGLVTGLAYPYVRDIIYQFRPLRRNQAD